MSDAPVAKTSHRSVLIVDIVASTSLYEKHGNIAATQMVEGCLKVLSDSAEAHKGRVIKSLGDGILCCFGSEEDAVWAAVSMCDETSKNGLEVRVGVHNGEIVEDAGDIFGDAVNTASRITDIAKASEILISGSLRDALPPFMQGIVRRVQPVTVKGKREPIELFAILREDGDTGGDISQTICLSKEDTAGPTATRTLELTFGEQTFQLGPGDDLAVGREAANGLVVPSKHVSRFHARVFHRSGKFLIEDKSANGTFLVPDQQPKIRIFREDAMLYGEGRIFFGADPDRTPSEPAAYRVG